MPEQIRPSEMMMSEELVPIDHPEIPGDCEIFEILIDGKSAGFVLIGPDGTNTLQRPEQALGIATRITQQGPKPGIWLHCDIDERFRVLRCL
ncbi:hypothetical protein E0H22_17005 [Rhodopseudomonas boonkerdii]|uniref:hypothetical protein n=1 Tax=Rhodopseudomonas boonkerdii TaxID=475937 RepID=UPI001E604E5C|nr:hypothetical protein [Rhodopseudomonas boonkerdii]UGV27235.1 hypothetical protein E0H22_17005 [Rhodopseudomonas boonkerdii]